MMGALGYYIFYGINWVITLLPLPVLYLVSDILYLGFYYFPSYRRKVVRTNLRNSFPEKTDKELKIIEKKFYRHLADLCIEVLKLTHADPEVPYFALNRVYVAYTVTPIIPGAVFGVVLPANMTFYRQVAMRSLWI